MTAPEGFALLEWDWLYGGDANRLHHATLTDEQYAEWADESQLEDETITLTCGMRFFWPSVPGLLSRMGMERCAHCCDRIGYHHGKGSPKNDALLRPFVEGRIRDWNFSWERRSVLRSART